MTRKFALVFGIVFLLVGILGFVPAAVHQVEGGHGMLLGLFPVNTLHNVIHLVFGLWGLAGSRSFAGAVTYAKSLGVIYVLLAILGLIPATNTVFGLVPIYGHDVWLHAVLGLAGLYFGFGPPSKVPTI